MSISRFLEIESFTLNNIIELPGHNGPYHDQETPARNAAHWIFALCSKHAENVEKRAEKIEQLLQVLLDQAYRPSKAAFWIRKNPYKDFCNGVIGQAWVIEALVKASEYLNRPGLYHIAEELFLQHDYIKELAVWRRLNVDGSYNTPDPVFNHQLWFAAAASMLRNTPKAMNRAQAFLEEVAMKVRLYGDGVVNHVSPIMKFPSAKQDKTLRVEAVLNKGFYYLTKKKFRQRSAGYHAFNLYAFAILKEAFPDHAFWETAKFNKMLDVTTSDKFRKEQLDNKYSYPYNPTGLEMAYVWESFRPEDTSTIQFWLEEQVRQTGEQGVSIMTKGSADPATSKARIYEACRLKKDYELNIDFNF